MASYITLVNWTDQGIREFKDTVSRTAAAKELAGRVGGQVKDVYWTLGPYDIVALGDFPDDETATAFMLALGSQGNTRSTTMRAFDSDQVQQIIAKLG
jgi:uncharacterized protein with GYD domain